MHIILLLISLSIMFLFCRTWTSVIAFVLICVFGTYESLLGVAQVCGFCVPQNPNHILTGSFYNPGPYGGFIAITMAVSCAYLLKNREHHSGLFQKSLYYIAAICFCVGWVVLPASLSRSAWVSLLAGLAFVIIPSQYFRGLIKETRRVIPTIVFFLLTISLGGFLLKRESAVGRFHIWRIEILSLVKEPLGTGWGTAMATYGKTQESFFREHINDVSARVIKIAGCPEYPFNEFLGLGMETGIIGLVISLGLFVFVAFVLRQKNSVFAAGMISLTVFAFASYPLSTPQISILLLIFLASSLPDIQCNIRAKIFMCVLAAVLLTISVYRTEKSDFVLVDRESFRDVYQRGYALFEMGKYEESIEMLNVGTELSSDPMFHVILGRNHESLGNYKLAEDEYIKAYYMVPCRIYLENPRVRDPRDRLRLTLFAEIGLSIGTDIKMTPVRELSGRGFFL